jgi:murein DD-endopeptidase MepM/ murein hydrolase activator NlpD
VIRVVWRGGGEVRTLNAASGLLCALVVAAGCGSTRPTEPVETCGPFPDWATSPYDLPYPAGRSYELRQANCSGFGHVGFWKHGYDFIMPIGSVVTAARGGTVGWARDGCHDGDQDCTNLVTILHDDGDVTVYSHLTRGGVLVTESQEVSQGDTIGLSGNTGYSTEPHLHFSLHPCNELPGLPGGGEGCPSQPFTLANTDPNPEGLEPYRWYLAR